MSAARGYHRQSQVKLVTAAGAAQTKHGILNILLGLSADAPISLVDDTERMVAAAVRDSAVDVLFDAQRTNPKIAKARAEVSAAEAAVDIARASGKPTIALTGSYARRDSRTYC